MDLLVGSVYCKIHYFIIQKHSLVKPKKQPDNSVSGNKMQDGEIAFLPPLRFHDHMPNVNPKPHELTVFIQ